MLNFNLKMALADAIKYIKDGQVDNIIKKSLTISSVCHI